MVEIALTAKINPCYCWINCLFFSLKTLKSLKEKKTKNRKNRLAIFLQRLVIFPFGIT